MYRFAASPVLLLLPAALFALAVTAPLSAVPVSETQTSAPAAMVASIDTTACDTVITPDEDAVAACSESFVRRLVAAAEDTCGEYGGQVGGFNLITCYYLGGGYYRINLTFHCTY